MVSKVQYSIGIDIGNDACIPKIITIVTTRCKMMSPEGITLLLYFEA